MIETCPQNDVGDYSEVEWLQLPIMGAGFRIFIGAQNKLAHLLQLPPADTDPTYVTWLTGDYFMMIWLLNSLEEKISGSVMFLPTAKTCGIH